MFEKLLDWAKENYFPIHWGTKGFSLNVDVAGKHVAFCFGYPLNSNSHQSIYTAFIGMGGLLSKVEIPEDVLNSLFTEAKSTGLFQTAGRELKILINRKFSDEEIIILIAWLKKLTGEVEKNGLKMQD